MQEHFNEKYLESDKYPYAEFKGKIMNDVDLSKDGNYPVTVQGDLNIHNVIKKYTINATINVQGGKIIGESKFNVKLVDHHVQIPTLIMKNIAEQVEVTISATMSAV
jgi:polyisoprenoid-binding protein YceI